MKLKEVQEAARRAAEEIERDWPQWKKDLSPVTSRAAEKQAARDVMEKITCQVCGKTYEYTPRGDGSPHPYQDEIMGYCGDSPPTEQVRGRGRGRALRLRKRGL